MKKFIICILILFCLTFSVSYAETKSAVILKGTGYGAIIGTLIGAAVMAFEDDPGDHLDYLYKGAAVGAIGGMLYGFYEAETFATIDENGNVKFAMPTIKTKVTETGLKSSVDILKVKF
jgi:hypothetical protein